jgi:hypothetical protein
MVARLATIATLAIAIMDAMVTGLIAIGRTEITDGRLRRYRIRLRELRERRRQ